MSDEEERKERGSTAIVLGPGAKNNTFYGMKMTGYENGVVTESDGVNFPEGNRFIGGEFNRHRATDSAQNQSSEPGVGGFKGYQVGVSTPLQTPSPLEDFTAVPAAPWYRELSIQVAGPVLVVLIISFFVWLGLPISF